MVDRGYRDLSSLLPPPPHPPGLCCHRPPGLVIHTKDRGGHVGFMGLNSRTTRPTPCQDPKGVRPGPLLPSLPPSLLRPYLKGMLPQVESLTIPSSQTCFGTQACLPTQVATFLTSRCAILIGICQLGPQPHTWLHTRPSLCRQILHWSLHWDRGWS